MRRVWILCILVGGVAAAVLPLSPSIVERWYSTGLYPAAQRAFTSVSNLVPFALLDVLLVVLPVGWLAVAIRDVSRASHRRQAVGRWALRTAAGVAALYLLFLLTWGLNYRRVPLERRLRYDASVVTTDAARAAAVVATSRLNALFVGAHTQPADDASAEGPLAVAFARATSELGATGTTVVGRPKYTLLNFYFRPAGVSGMTDPFFLETLVAGDLLATERPFVIAHEWSHLAGFADEGEANFAGWLTCVRADVASQYSGWLCLFGELVNSMPRADRSAVMARLGTGPRSDLRAIAERVRRDVKPQVSGAGWLVYDKYLKANRIEAGAASYAQVVRLVLGTRLGVTGEQLASPAR